MEILRKYNEQTTVYFPLIARGSQDLVTGATFAGADSMYSEDGTAFGNTTNSPVEEGEGLYSIVLEAGETDAKIITVRIEDQTPTKVWEDQVFIVATYGHTSAQHAFDFDNPIDNTYQAKVWLLDDDSGVKDRYAASFYKNGGLITSGVTGPTTSLPDIWVFAMDAPATALVGTSGTPLAMTAASTTATFFHDEGSNRVVDGTQYMARIRWIADGVTHTWMQPVGRDN